MKRIKSLFLKIKANLIDPEDELVYFKYFG